MGYFTCQMPVRALNNIYERSEQLMEKVLSENRPKLLAAWRAVACLLHTVETEGLLALEEKLRDGTVRRTGAPNYDFLAAVILACVDGYDRGLVLDMMVSDYYVNHYGDAEKVCAFFYMAGILECTDRNADYDMKCTAGEAMQKNLSLLPEEYRQEFAVCCGVPYNPQKELAPFPWKELTEDGGSSLREEGDGSDGGFSREDFARKQDLKTEMLQQAGGLAKEDFFRMQSAIARVYELAEGAYKEGLRYVEEYGRSLRETGEGEELFLCEAVRMMYDEPFEFRHSMLEMYGALERNAQKDWIRFIYMEAASMIGIGLKPRIVRDVCAGMLPSGYREHWKGIWKKGGKKKWEEEPDSETQQKDSGKWNSSDPLLVSLLDTFLIKNANMGVVSMALLGTERSKNEQFWREKVREYRTCALQDGTVKHWCTCLIAYRQQAKVLEQEGEENQAVLVYAELVCFSLQMLRKKCHNALVLSAVLGLVRLANWKGAGMNLKMLLLRWAYDFADWMLSEKEEERYSQLVNLLSAEYKDAQYLCVNAFREESEYDTFRRKFPQRLTEMAEKLREEGDIPGALRALEIAEPLLGKCTRRSFLESDYDDYILSLRLRAEIEKQGGDAGCGPDVKLLEEKAAALQALKGRLLRIYEKTGLWDIMVEHEYDWYDVCRQKIADVGLSEEETRLFWWEAGNYGAKYKDELESVTEEIPEEELPVWNRYVLPEMFPDQESDDFLLAVLGWTEEEWRREAARAMEKLQLEGRELEEAQEALDCWMRDRAQREARGQEIRYEYDDSFVQEMEYSEQEEIYLEYYWLWKRDSQSRIFYLLYLSIREVYYGKHMLDVPALSSYYRKKENIGYFSCSGQSLR